MNQRRRFRFAVLAALPLAFSATAQVISRGEQLELTLEGYGNVTTAVSQSVSRGDQIDGADSRLDAGLRGLARWRNPSGPDIGLRIVGESAPEQHATIAEASLLLFGDAGRLELGKRPGLPDVLSGYAPNNFAFTSAEFGPASGPSLDPGGGLQHAFLARSLAQELNDLSTLGASTSLAGDRSAKIVYVSPKHKGFLAGISYAPKSDDPRFGPLLQTGLVHERYWESNILRLGGSVTAARANPSSTPSQRSLRSFNASATLILNYDWMFGFSGTWNGTSGLSRSLANTPSEAYGATASVNYNHGRWTTGAYYQWSTSEGDTLSIGNDQLRAVEAGVSYRLTTKLRFYGAVYSFDFNNEGGRRPADRHHATQLLVGVRATL